MLPSGAGSSSGKRPLSWTTVSGWLAASRAASTMRVIRVWSMGSVRGSVMGGGVVGCGIVGGVGVVEFAAQVERRVAVAGRQRLHVDRRQRRFLHDVEQVFLRQLQDGEEGHDHAEAALGDLEQRFE